MRSFDTDVNLVFFFLKKNRGNHVARLQVKDGQRCPIGHHN